MSYPIDSPEYATQRRRLQGIIRGKHMIHAEEPDASKKKGRTWYTSPGNPCAEGFLPQGLRHISLARVRDLL